jgi:hypothetical protein
VGLTIFIYVRLMAFRSTSMFLPGKRLVFGSLLFIADKFEDLSLHEPGTDHVPPILDQVSLIFEA